MTKITNKISGKTKEEFDQVVAYFMTMGYQLNEETVFENKKSGEYLGEMEAEFDFYNEDDANEKAAFIVDDKEKSDVKDGFYLAKVEFMFQVPSEEIGPCASIFEVIHQLQKNNQTINVGLFARTHPEKFNVIKADEAKEKGY